MVEVTMQISDDLAQRIRPMSVWLPMVIELSLIGCRTPAAATAAEIIEFLASNPSGKDVLGYHASERSQERLRRLLALNEAGLLSEDEQLELDELQQIEHFVVMLKADVATKLR